MKSSVSSDPTRMIKVKVSAPTREGTCVSRQLPEASGLWGNCQFFVNDDLEECDYWVIFESVSGEESAICRRENTILVTAEPPHVKLYDSLFCGQFGGVITCQEQVRHRNLVLSQQGLPWRLGLGMVDRKNCIYSSIMSYNELVDIDASKEKLVSVFVSGKSYVRGHLARDEFVSKLKERLGDKIDVYGRGHLSTFDKREAMVPYKYHIVIENTRHDHYWSEKLADAYLAGCYPIYYGCENISEYFQSDMLTEIDIEKADAAIDKIESIVHSDRWRECAVPLAEAKRRVMEEYNFFGVVEKYIRDRERSKSARTGGKRSRVTIKADPVEPILLKLIRGPIRRITRKLSRQRVYPDLVS